MPSFPVNIKAVMDEAFKINEATETSLSVSVYLDESAQSDLQAYIRQVFASAAPQARVSLTYLDSRPFSVFEDDDMAVIVAGMNPQVGAYAAQLRDAGVPVMVVTTEPDFVADLAATGRYPIPRGDLIAPLEKVSLDDRMGRWVIEACRHKRLAFARAFPFARRSLALESVNATSVQNAGIGLVPILAGADMPVMTLNQSKMVLEIAAIYGEELNLSRVKEIVAVVAGAFAFRGAARRLATVVRVPVLGWIVKGGIGYVGTEVLGRTAIRYYEGGASVGALAQSVVESGSKAVKSIVDNVTNQVHGGDSQKAMNA